MEKICITPQMLRAAVKELQMRQLFVKLEILKKYIQKHYPVENNFEEELQEKLRYAVCVGLLAKDDNDQYYIPDLRQEANTVKTAISAFWELYKKNNRPRNTRKKKGNSRSISYRREKQDHINSSKSNETDSSEDLDFIKK